jgi:hypothetical protein
MWEQRALERVSFSDDCRAVITTSDSGRERRTWSILRGIAQAQPLRSAGEETGQPPPSTADPSPTPAPPKRGGTLKTRDGRLSLAIGADGSVRISDATKDKAETELQGVPENVLSAEFSPDGARVLVCVSGENRETAGLWDPISGNAVSALVPADSDSLNEGGFSPDSRRLVVFGEGLLRVLDTQTGKEVRPPESMAGVVKTISFTSDSTLFATAGTDLQIWSAVDGRPLINAIKAPRIHLYTTVAFNHDGRRFVASTVGGIHEADQSSAQLFDTATGAPLSDAYQSEGNGGNARFGPEGRTIVEGLDIRWQWDAPPEQPPPSWLAEFAEAVAGQRLSATGVSASIDPASALTAVKNRLPPATHEDAWTKLAQWFLAEAGQRTISPFSTIRVSDYLAEGLKSESYRDLQKASHAAPENALVHARLGLRHLDEEEETGAKAKVFADHETLLATKLDPGSAEVWKARAKVLAALERPAEAAAAAKIATELSRR